MHVGFILRFLPCGGKMATSSCGLIYYTASLVTVLVSQSCLNKLPHTVWFKTTEIYSPTIVEPEVGNQGVGRVGSFWRLGGIIHSMPLSKLLVAASKSWHSLACGCITVISFSIVTSPFSLFVYFFLFLLTTLVVRYRSHFNPE